MGTGVDTPGESENQRPPTGGGGRKIVIEKRIIGKFTLLFWTRHPPGDPVHNAWGSESAQVCIRTYLNRGKLSQQPVLDLTREMPPTEKGKEEKLCKNRKFTRDGGSAPSNPYKVQICLGYHGFWIILLLAR